MGYIEIKIKLMAEGMLPTRAHQISEAINANDAEKLRGLTANIPPRLKLIVNDIAKAKGL